MNNTPEKNKDTKESLSLDVQTRIMQSCEEAGMPCDWLQTLHMILREIDNPERLAKLLEVRVSNRAMVIQGAREQIEEGIR